MTAHKETVSASKVGLGSRWTVLFISVLEEQAERLALLEESGTDRRGVGLAVGSGDGVFG